MTAGCPGAQFVSDVVTSEALRHCQRGLIKYLPKGACVVSSPYGCDSYDRPRKDRSVDLFCSFPQKCSHLPMRAWKLWASLASYRSHLVHLVSLEAVGTRHGPHGTMLLRMNTTERACRLIPSRQPSWPFPLLSHERTSAVCAEQSKCHVAETTQRLLAWGQEPGLCVGRANGNCSSDAIRQTKYISHVKPPKPHAAKFLAHGPKRACRGKLQIQYGRYSPRVIPPH